MPYRKKFQREKKKLAEELGRRVEKGEISDKQAFEIAAAWNREQVKFNECGDKPDVTVTLDVRRKILQM